jgi:hypothetical protein
MTRIQFIKILFYYSYMPISKYYRCYNNVVIFVINIIVIIVVTVAVNVVVQFFCCSTSGGGSTAIRMSFIICTSYY